MDEAGAGILEGFKYKSPLIFFPVTSHSTYIPMPLNNEIVFTVL